MQDKLWVCPDVDEILLWRNPFFDKNLDGIAFEMVVNDCSISAEIEATLPEKSYASDIECELSKAKRIAKIPRISVNSMITGMYVDVRPPGMQLVEEVKFKYQSMTGLLSTMSQTDVATAVQNKHYYSQSLMSRISQINSLFEN
mmetsp:Transcript_5941/g.8047  ORF Transcript_5941/g.8047 Transcript_5941/m.8047 type:complete len:144 (-) Transcript_5941:1034-1465(-)